MTRAEFRENLLVSLDTLRAHKVRSMLTLLGVVIGVTSVISVAAIIGGLASYPIAAIGAIMVGLLEAFSSFWASAYKEVIVFGSIIPVLLWRSLRDPHSEEH